MAIQIKVIFILIHPLLIWHDLTFHSTVFVDKFYAEFGLHNLQNDCATKFRKDESVFRTCVHLRDGSSKSQYSILCDTICCYKVICCSVSNGRRKLESLILLECWTALKCSKTLVRILAACERVHHILDRVRTVFCIRNKSRIALVDLGDVEKV